MRSIGEAMQVELDSYHISGEQEGEKLVLKAMDSGVDAIVGGLMVTKLAADRSFPAVMIESAMNLSGRPWMRPYEPPLSPERSGRGSNGSGQSWITPTKESSRWTRAAGYPCSTRSPGI